MNARADSCPSELGELLVACCRPARVPSAAVPPPRSRRGGVPGWEVGQARASQRACVLRPWHGTGGAQPARHAPARQRHGRKPGRGGGGEVTRPHGEVADRAAGRRFVNAAHPAERVAAIGLSIGTLASDLQEGPFHKLLDLDLV